jgi:hypothetical protein
MSHADGLAALSAHYRIRADYGGRFTLDVSGYRPSATETYLIPTS